MGAALVVNNEVNRGISVAVNWEHRRRSATAISLAPPHGEQKGSLALPMFRLKACFLSDQYPWYTQKAGTNARVRVRVKSRRADSRQFGRF